MKKKKNSDFPPKLLAFRKAVKKYLRHYGLLNFTFTFEIKKLPDGSEAQCEYNVGEARGACFRVDENARDEAIDELAHHEVLELLLAELATMANETYDSKQVDRESHKVIYSVMNAGPDRKGE